ncbi:MAG: hypothetical protein GWN84_12360, partial [Gammaproteobacteria bacterium]|nr:hypothetical protein [Gammaproteobacteria bacterium]NIR83699.1 hypothetical protein [Gammaproteobacteria bacterium]NIR91846.1 hypothetical protein [Gammaproteobacteria bacterium]NIU04865.1 hypothetical protein [Gammaproteobacteria bacterium]NIV51847.1 hypothetical protein [Gammaproteobacteria bacterium]
HCEANAAAKIHVEAPPRERFEREALLAAPEIAEGVLPRPLPPARRGLLHRGLVRAGDGLGSVTTIVFKGATELWGRLVGYRGEVWTNWYRRWFYLAILTLAYMRERLNRDNLKSTYPRDALTAFQPEGQTPPEGVTHSRTADGSWNNLANPKEGAAYTRFLRNVEDDAIRPETGEALMTPNPREVSRVLLTRDEFKGVPFLNLLAASWIQFQNHDWVSHGDNPLREIHEIPLAEDDPARTKYRQSNMFVVKTQPDPTRQPEGEKTPVTYINEVTHWWDGSQIYGSDQATQMRLRSGVDGKLKLTADGRLPPGKGGIEDTGFNRNWWVGLSMLHTLFAREHNAICERLKSKYPHWDDNRLFNVARLINAAVMAKIHTVEWTPAILPNRAAHSGLNANWYGLVTNFLRYGKHRRTLAPFNIQNPEAGGVVGNRIDKHGSPYGLTEEFVEVYRLHPLMPETLRIRRTADGADIEEIPVAATRQAASPALTRRLDMADLFYSFGNQHPGQLVLNNFPRFMQELSVPGNPVFDLGAVDILRARERGVPRYNEFRRQLGLNPIRTFEDLTDDAEHVRKLKGVYGDQPQDVEKLDLLVGTLAEGQDRRPTGFGFGETLFQIFILNATRRLQADRFYTDAYNEDVYTKEGLDWIDDADLKTVILRHYPELGRTGLANVRNAFEPWDTDERLDPTRHPLRAFDKTLADPWRGDAAPA